MTDTGSCALTTTHNITDCWESSAGYALQDLWFAGGNSRPRLDWVTSIEDSLPNSEELGDSPENLRAQFLHIGYTTIVNNEWLTYNDMLELVIGKQRDYGHGNILKYGLLGITVRLSDKIERLKHLTMHRSPSSIGKNGPVNESTDDTKMDIVGYTILALMLIDNTFTKQLLADHPSQGPF